MIRKLMHTFALSEKGAKGFIKATVWTYICNLSLMIPIMAVMAVVMYMVNTLEAGLPIEGRVLYYSLIALGVVILLFILHYFQYASLYISVYDESAARRISLAEVLRRLPLSYFGKKDLSDLTTTLISDCSVLDMMFSHYIPELFASLASTLTIAVMLFVANWKMAAAILWVFPIGLIMAVGTKALQDKYGKKNIEAKLKVADSIQSGLETIREMKACNMQEEYIRELDERLVRSEKASIHAELATGSTVCTAQALLRLGMASAVIVGITLLLSGELDFIYFTGFMLCAARIYDPLSIVLQNIAAMLNAKLKIDRMRNILEYPVQTGTDKFSPESFDIEFRNVSFAYNENEGVLKNVSFTAKQGEVTALVGHSGCGKSTATRLAARFWDVDEGTITLGGTDVSTVDPETLLSNYSIVFQDVVLFRDTIMENIRLGRKGATDEEVLAVAKAARCDEFVSRLPEGYSTMIGENGSTLSGGERQRISIARALLKNAPVILLDEATASLDVENESVVQAAISELVKDKTVLIIAHRMRTVENADKVIVLENGSVAETGTPDELKAADGIFARMISLQKESGSWQIK